MLAVLTDPVTVAEAHARVAIIRSRQVADATRGPDRDWLFIASPKVDPVLTTAREIIRQTAEAFGVTSADITGERRGQVVIAARFAAYHAVAIAHPGWSFRRIGLAFGRDHTVVRKAVRKMERDGVPQPPASSGRSMGVA